MGTLLERDDELGVLAEAVEAAAAGRGTVVLVGGEAGIGKTTLVRALRERAGAEATFLTGACEPLSVPVPLAPLRELSEAAGAGDLAELGTGDRLVDARRLLAALAKRAPAVAVIEDAHWADPLTLDLLRILARRVEDVGVVLLVTYRDDEVAANPALGLLLGDLATSPLVRRVAPRPLSDAAVRELAGAQGLDVARLARATGGNPFLVVESIASGGRLPASVRDAALARAGRLGGAAREVVDAGAVIGQRFGPALLQALVPGAGDAIEEALTHGVLVAEGNVLGFRHDLIREAIESSISPPRRAELHARVTAALADLPEGADNARLAHHAELGGLTADACRYAARAAEEAQRVGALREVHLQAERALRLGAELDDGERFELLLLSSRASNFSNPRLEEAVASAEQAVELADRLGDPVRRARALMVLSGALWSLERVEEARTAAAQAVAVLEPMDEPAVLARAYSTLMRMDATSFDPASAIELGPRALELAEAAGLEELRVDVMISVGLAKGHRGDREAFDVLAAALERSRAARLTIPTVRTYVNLTMLAMAMRDHDRLEQTVDEGLPLLEEYGTLLPALAIRLYRARSLLDRGRYEEALKLAAVMDEVLEGEMQVGEGIEGLIRVRRGDAGGHTQLERAWEELWRIVPAEGSRHGMLRLALVEAAWLRDDPATAVAQLEAAGESPASARFARSGAELALWGSRYGVELEPPPGAPEAVRLELAGDWRGAIKAWHEVEAPYEAALAALPGDDRAARDALATLHRLGADAAAKAFRRDRAARAGRAARGPRRSTLANPAGLTRREQEVLACLATGATNAAIAASLHLSTRTVAHHVTAILGKLDAPNRVAAIERARAKGLLAQDGTGGVPNWDTSPM